jgi:hypothetical protein
MGAIHDETTSSREGCLRFQMRTRSFASRSPQLASTDATEEFVDVIRYSQRWFGKGCADPPTGSYPAPRDSRNVDCGRSTNSRRCAPMTSRGHSSMRPIHWLQTSAAIYGRSSVVRPAGLASSSGAFSRPGSNKNASTKAYAATRRYAKVSRQKSIRSWLFLLIL